MKKLIGLIMWAVVLALPALNAQQPSPDRTVTTSTTPQRRLNGNHGQAHFEGPPRPGVSAQPVAHHQKAPTKNPADPGKPNNNADNNGKNISYAEALKRCRNERHDRDWWKRRHLVIVLVGGGYYYWDAGYWYPAWGYDTANETYDYNGPIYTYNNLLPDQVVINVQQALKELGYYSGDINGSLGAATRHALKTYQADNGLDVNGAVDAPTVFALGLVES